MNNMRSITTIGNWLGLVAGVCSLALPALAAPDFENNLEKTYSVSPGGKFVLQADRGSCEISPIDGNDVRIRVLRGVNGGTKAEADALFANHEVTFQQADGVVSVLAKNKKDSSWSWRPNRPSLQVRYEISVPRKFNVDLKTAGGDVRVGDLDGDVKARTSSGSIHLARTAGKVEAGDAGGDIVVEEAGGDLSARTSSGAIRVRKAGGSVEATDAGGDIQIGEAGQSVTAGTSSGSIELKSVKGDVEARDAGGDITIGAVDGAIKAQTSSGAIKIKAAKGDVVARDSGGDVRIGTAGSVEAQTSSGSIEIGAASGRVEAKDAGGNISIEAVGGPVLAQTSSGDVRITSAKGKVEARDAGGNIAVKSAYGAVHANTSSGAITVGFLAQPAEESRLEVAGGDVTVSLTKSAAVDVDARSNGGNFSSELPVTIETKNGQPRGAVQGKINGGGPLLLLRSSSGDIRLKSSDALMSKAEK